MTNNSIRSRESLQEPVNSRHDLEKVPKREKTLVIPGHEWMSKKCGHRKFVI